MRRPRPPDPDFNDPPTRDAVMALMNALTPQTASHRRHRVPCLAGRAAGGRPEAQGRARPAIAWADPHAAHRRGGTGAHRCRRLVPRRRPGHRQAGQPAPADPEDQGAVPDRHRRQRRREAAGRQDLLREAFAKAQLPAEIEVYAGTHARLVPAGLAGLQRRRPQRRPGRACWCCSRQRSKRQASPRGPGRTVPGDLAGALRARASGTCVPPC